MFDRFRRSFDLLKSSATVLKADRTLLVFPLISSVAMILVILCFALPMFGIGAFDGLHREREGSPLLYSAAFLFYVVQYFVIFYFNAALVGCVLARLDGGSATVKDGLRMATARFGTILGYAVINATIGVILRTIEERVGFLGRFIVGLFGIAWNMATFLVVPVLVASDVGPVQAVRESAALLKRTWGENVAGQVGLGFAFGMLQLAVVLIAAVLIGGVVALDMPLLALPIILLAIPAMLAMMLVHSALSAIYSAVLYRYASNGDSTIGFDDQALVSAFLPKK